MDHDQGTVTGVSIAAGRFFIIIIIIKSAFPSQPERLSDSRRLHESFVLLASWEQ